MDITQYIDDFGDDVYALALVTTKNFASAKEIFVKTAELYEQFSEEGGLFPVVREAFSLCRQAECNDSAVTLTGVELDPKKRALLENVLQRPFVTRAVIHLFWENDLTPEQIAELTGESVKHVNSIIEGLPEPVASALDDRYKDICLRIHAENKLKAYVIRSLTSSDKRMFEVENEAVPVHRWTKKQKIIIIVVAAVVTTAVFFLIPMFRDYYNMRKEENFESFENLSDGLSFTYELDRSDTTASVSDSPDKSGG